MPQLDQVTFFSQFFWLCFFFFTFYFFICKDFLPEMGRILKLRKKKMNFSAEGTSSIQQENEKVRASCKTLLENGLNTSSNLIVSHKEHIDSWLLGVVAETNKKQLQNSNELYIQWVGDNCIRQQIALGAAAPFVTPRIFASLLVEKCQKKHRIAKQSAANSESRSDSLDQLVLEKAAGGKKGGLKK